MSTDSRVHSVSAAVVWPTVAGLRCALLCCSLAKACRKLGILYMNADKDTCEVVLDGLLQARPGNRSDGEPLTYLLVPGR